MDDFLEKKPKTHIDAVLATAARFSWVLPRKTLLQDSVPVQCFCVCVKPITI